MLLAPRLLMRLVALARAQRFSTYHTRDLPPVPTHVAQGAARVARGAKRKGGHGSQLAERGCLVQQGVGAAALGQQTTYARARTGQVALGSDVRRLRIRYGLEHDALNVGLFRGPSCYACGESVAAVRGEERGAPCKKTPVLALLRNPRASIMLSSMIHLGSAPRLAGTQARLGSVPLHDGHVVRHEDDGGMWRRLSRDTCACQARR